MYIWIHLTFILCNFFINLAVDLTWLCFIPLCMRKTMIRYRELTLCMVTYIATTHKPHRRRRHFFFFFKSTQLFFPLKYVNQILLSVVKCDIFYHYYLQSTSILKIEDHHQKQRQREHLFLTKMIHKKKNLYKIFFLHVKS